VPDLNERPQRPVKTKEDIVDMNDVQQRIDALKKRTMPTQTNIPRFSYDSSQPLHLPPNMKKSKE
jgi:hypothetical protein